MRANRTAGTSITIHGALVMAVIVFNSVDYRYPYRYSSRLPQSRSSGATVGLVEGPELGSGSQETVCSCDMEARELVAVRSQSCRRVGEGTGD